MRAPNSVTAYIARHMEERFSGTTPDFIVGGGNGEIPYLLRWYVTGKKEDGYPKKILGSRGYYHRFLRSDDDRAHHDHPARSLSLALKGRVCEHQVQAGGVQTQRVIRAGDIIYRSGTFAHRLEIMNGEPFESLFIFGPNYREWGFHCPNGWKHWKEFTDTRDGKSEIGRGCD